MAVWIAVAAAVTCGLAEAPPAAGGVLGWAAGACPAPAVPLPAPAPNTWSSACFSVGA